MFVCPQCFLVLRLCTEFSSPQVAFLGLAKGCNVVFGVRSEVEFEELLGDSTIIGGASAEVDVGLEAHAAPASSDGAAASSSGAELHGAVAAEHAGPRLSGSREAHMCSAHLAHGSIRLYEKLNCFVAECTYPGHGRCRLTRKSTAHCNPSRYAQGRPLGLLAAWLKAAPSYTSQAEHSNPFVACSFTFAERVSSRGELSAQPGYAALAMCERPSRDGEGEEPENCA
jgi:hypothetical protein